MDGKQVTLFSLYASDHTSYHLNRSMETETEGGPLCDKYLMLCFLPHFGASAMEVYRLMHKIKEYP